MDVHLAENNDSDGREVSPRARGVVKHMKAYFETHDGRDTDDTTSSHQASVQSFVSDAEVKCSKFDIRTSVEEHRVCPECGDFQAECRCGRSRVLCSRPSGARAALRSDPRPSECSFISNASLSSLLPSSTGLFDSDSSLTGKQLEDEARQVWLMNQGEAKVEEYGLEAGDHYRAVTEDDCKPSYGGDGFPLPPVIDESVSSLILFPPSDGAYSEDNIKQNEDQELGQMSTCDILSQLEQEISGTPNTTTTPTVMDGNERIHEEVEEKTDFTVEKITVFDISSVKETNYKEISIKSDRKKKTEENNLKSNKTITHNETSSPRTHLLDSVSPRNTDIHETHDIYKVTNDITPVERDIELSMGKDNSPVDELHSDECKLYHETKSEAYSQNSSDNMKYGDEETDVNNDVEYENLKEDEIPDDIDQFDEELLREPDMYFLEQHKIEWFQSNTCTQGSKCTDDLLSAYSEPKMNTPICSEITSSIINEKVSTENTNETVFPEREQFQYKDLSISGAPFFQQLKNEWLPIQECVMESAENESSYNENSDVVSLEESSPKLVVYSSSSDAFRRVLHNQIVYQTTDKKWPLKIGKFSDLESVSSLTSFLSDRYSTQEQLANYANELDNSRCQLIQEILKKDDRIDRLKKKLNVLESEIRYINRENSVLSNILESCNNKENGTDGMEFESHKSKTTTKGGKHLHEEASENNYIMTSPEEELLKHKCDELREKNKNIDTEIAALRLVAAKKKFEHENTLKAQKQTSERIAFLKEKILMAETEYRKVNLLKEECAGKEQQVVLYEQRLNEAKTDLEDLKTMVQEQAFQAKCYKEKYQQVRKEADELKNKLENAEAHTKHMICNADSDVQRVKDQIQEELLTLNTLTGQLESTQIKLQEESQKHYVTEQQCENLQNQAQDVKEKVCQLAKELELQRNNLEKNEKQQSNLQALLVDVKKRNSELKDEISILRTENSRLKELKERSEKHSLEKSMELDKLSAQIADVDGGFGVRLKREKDDGEQKKHFLQEEISEMEKQIAALHATSNKVQQEKEEVRQKMQSQITQLTRNLEESQQRIIDLQKQAASFIKHTECAR